MDPSASVLLGAGPLPALELPGLVETVTDETEIPDAVGRLLGVLCPDGSPPRNDVVLGYDPTTDDTVIVVSAAMADPVISTAATRTIGFPPIERAAVVRLDERPSSTADAWVALDAELEARGLRAVGQYRHTLHASGAVTLAVPVVASASSS